MVWFLLGLKNGLMPDKSKRLGKDAASVGEVLQFFFGVGGILCSIVYVVGLFRLRPFLRRSIPVDVRRVGRTLFVAEGVGEFGGFGADGEVEGGVGIEHHVAGHLEAVEVAREGGGGHRDAVAREVVAGGEVDVPSFGQRDVARKVECLVEREGIAHVGAADGLGAVFHHRDAVGEGDVPGQGEGQITVFVDFGFGLLLGFAFLLAEHGVDVGVFLRIAVVEVLLVGVGVRVAGSRRGGVVAIGVEDFVPSASGEEAEEGHELLPVEGVG